MGFSRLMVKKEMLNYNLPLNLALHVDLQNAILDEINGKIKTVPTPLIGQRCESKAFYFFGGGLEREVLLLHVVLSNMYMLLTKREVKMAGYWPSSLFAFLWTETQSRSIKT